MPFLKHSQHDIFILLKMFSKNMNYSIKISKYGKMNETISKCNRAYACARQMWLGSSFLYFGYYAHREVLTCLHIKWDISTIPYLVLIPMFLLESKVPGIFLCLFFGEFYPPLDNSGFDLRPRRKSPRLREEAESALGWTRWRNVVTRWKFRGVGFVDIGKG